MSVKLVSYTKIDEEYLKSLMSEVDATDPHSNEFIVNIQTPEGLAAYCARVSSPNPYNHEYSKLLKYCLKHGHFSVFEMINVTFEINTTRMISSQILRHKRLFFQERSQRYQQVSDYTITDARRQDAKNRQNSIDDLDEDTKTFWESTQNMLNKKAFQYYQMALDKGIAKEIARSILPLSTNTTMYANGTLRSWIHYVNVRASKETQKEHRDIAIAIRDILIDKYPSIAEACEWEKSNV